MLQRNRNAKKTESDGLQQPSKHPSVEHPHGTFLQSVSTRPGVSEEHSQAVIARMMRSLFDHGSGALYIVNSSQGDLEISAVWGEHSRGEGKLARRIGRGLLENRIILGEGEYIPVLPPAEAKYRGQVCMCVPLAGEEGMLGLLYARFREKVASPDMPVRTRIAEQRERFAIAAAKTLALTLTGLTMAR